MTLKQLRKKIEDIEVTYNYEETYSNLYNTCIDYMNDSQQWFLEECFDEIYDYDTVEMFAKQELENGGLVRLYYFLGDANFNNDIFRINAYGNCQDVTKDDLDDLKERILDAIDYEIENNKGDE